MRTVSSLAFALSLSVGALAQQGPWQQCGGNGWTGATTCVSGWSCVKENDWYWQCRQVPTTLSTSSTKVSTTAVSSTAKSSSKTSTAAVSSTTSASGCAATFSPISAEAYVAAVNPGWNLGNTLDAYPDEGSWNNRPVVPATFDDIKAAGFKSVLTYRDHFTGGSPNWTVDPTWLQRVSDVVDMATTRGLYVLTNVHHDSTTWADITQANANFTLIQEKFYRLWYQIGVKLACKSSLVAFETINEPPANTAADGALINQFNEIFLKALADSGGFNTKRVVTLNGGGMDGLKTTQWFKPPANVLNPWALQFHYYSPYDFVFGAWGKTIWGSAEDKATLKNDLAIVRGNFTNVPILIGEYGATPIWTERAARWKWTDYFVRTAAELKMAVILWDNGADNFERDAHLWRDPVSVDIIKNAARGISNSLADSTIDGSAATQFSSAFLWNQVGSAPAAQTLPWLFNGNTLKSIKTNQGAALSSPQDYSVSSSSITFTQSFLAKYFSATANPGSKANLTLAFSAGAASNIELIQWDTPTLATSTSKAVAGSDLSIQIGYKGFKAIAAVKAQTTAGVYLFDDWTQWLGPLQQARATINNHYTFEVFQDPRTQVFKTLNVGSYFREGGFWSRNVELDGAVNSNQSRFFSQATEGRLGDEAAKYSATVHIDCLNLYMRNSPMKNKLQLLWIVSTWRYPWLRAEPLRLPAPDELVEDEEVLGSILNMSAYRRVHPEVKQLIWDYANAPILQRFQSVLRLCRHLGTLSHDSQIVRLCQVQYWARGSSLALCKETSPQAMIRLSIDYQGLQKIEQVEMAQSVRSKPSKDLVYVAEAVEAMEEVMVEMKVCLLSFYNTSLNITPRRAFPFDTSPQARFATIDTLGCSGITFFYAEQTLVDVLAHHNRLSAPAPRMSTPSRFLRRTKSKSLTWVYLPLSKADRIIGFGVCVTMEEERPRQDRPTILVRLEKSGSIMLGPDHTTEDQTRARAASTSPGPILLHETGGASIKTICELSSSNIPVATDIFPLSPFSICPLDGACFSSARLDSVTFTEVYYDPKAFDCRGIILTYKNGGKRVLGQCRVGIDPSRTCRTPVRLRVFGKVILDEQQREPIQVVGVEFQADLQDRSEVPREIWAGMEGVLEFWFTAKESIATLVTGESISAALNAYDEEHLSMTETA
ncbi:endoglucanase B [Paramyrothecium foliicola]|nr:endoglucanase B [Paramyrothecium foliicola]